MTTTSFLLVIISIATLSCGGPQAQGVPGPVSLHGAEPTTTEAINLPAYFTVVAMSHAGRGRFAVHVLRDRWYGNEQEQLIEESGPYKGRRVLKTGSPIRLKIETDGGNWTVAVTALQCCGDPAGFAGAGDDVSDEIRWRESFPTNWAFVHEGTGNFAVRLHFGQGHRTIINSVGPVRDEAIVSCGEALIVVGGGNTCFWEVRADGRWSIRRK